MKRSLCITNTNPLVPVSYALVLAALAAGVMTVPFSLRLAMLPSAAIFGWCQIGGL